MAVDTRDKRSNCLNIGSPWKFSAPNPDGSLAIQADRQHIAYAYRGIAASGGGGGSTIVIMDRSFHRFHSGGISRRVN